MGLAVLLVDDEAEHHEPVRRGLQVAAPKAKLLTARTGHEGLAVLRRTLEADIDDVAAILLDLGLHDQSGIDVLRELRAQAATRRIPVVVLTRSAHEVDIWLSYKVGANAYLIKDASRFAEQIAQAANFWCNHNQRLPASAHAG